MHIIHLLDFNTLSTNVILSRTSILKEIILFSSHGCNVNMRNQWPVPHNMGELALDIPFLISLKIKLSFIPTHVHVCTPVLMAQPKQKQGFKHTDNFSEFPSLLSSVSTRRRDRAPHIKSFSDLCHQNSISLLPSTHLKPSGTNHLVLTAPTPPHPPPPPPPPHQSPLQRGKSLAVESTRKNFPHC